jgi:RNA polymerase sigma factor (sigma-70 family)
MTVEGAGPRDDLSVPDLVTCARSGNQQAWDALVERYAPLVWSICRRYRLSAEDAADLSQSVWLRLVEQLPALRDPAAFAGWLATTTRRECCSFLRAARRQPVLSETLDAETMPDTQADTADQELLAAERRAALREAFGHLPPRCQRLLAILVEDPPVPYAEISSRLGIAVGSIGPIRSRCIDRLRRDPAIAALIDTEADSAGALQAGSAQRRSPPA